MRAPCSSNGLHKDDSRGVEKKGRRSGATSGIESYARERATTRENNVSLSSPRPQRVRARVRLIGRSSLRRRREGGSNRARKRFSDPIGLTPASPVNPFIGRTNPRVHGRYIYIRRRVYA